MYCIVSHRFSRAFVSFCAAPDGKGFAVGLGVGVAGGGFDTAAAEGGLELEGVVADAFGDQSGVGVAEAVGGVARQSEQIAEVSILPPCVRGKSLGAEGRRFACRFEEGSYNRTAAPSRRRLSFAASSTRTTARPFSPSLSGVLFSRMHSRKCRHSTANGSTNLI